MKKIILIIGVLLFFFSCENPYNEGLRKALKDRDLAKAKELISKGADTYTAAPVLGTTAFLLAAEFGDIQFIKELISKGEDVNQVDSSRATALMNASYYGHVQLVKFLLDMGAEVNRTSYTGDTALLSAARGKNNYEVVKLLLAYKADATVISEMTGSVLWNALDTDDPRVVKILLEHGADPNYKTEAGWSLLAWAITHKYNEVAEILRQYGAKE